MDELRTTLAMHGRMPRATCAHGGELGALVRIACRVDPIDGGAASKPPVKPVVTPEKIDTSPKTSGPAPTDDRPRKKKAAPAGSDRPATGGVNAAATGAGAKPAPTPTATRPASRNRSIDHEIRETEQRRLHAARDAGSIDAAVPPAERDRLIKEQRAAFGVTTIVIRAPGKVGGATGGAARGTGGPASGATTPPAAATQPDRNPGSLPIPGGHHSPTGSTTPQAKPRGNLPAGGSRGGPRPPAAPLEKVGIPTTPPPVPPYTPPQTPPAPPREREPGAPGQVPPPDPDPEPPQFPFPSPPKYDPSPEDKPTPTPQRLPGPGNPSLPASQSPAKPRAAEHPPLPTNDQLREYARTHDYWVDQSGEVWKLDVDDSDSVMFARNNDTDGKVESDPSAVRYVDYIDEDGEPVDPIARLGSTAAGIAAGHDRLRSMSEKIVGQGTAPAKAHLSEPANGDRSSVVPLRSAVEAALAGPDVATRTVSGRMVIGSDDVERSDHVTIATLADGTGITSITTQLRAAGSITGDERIAFVKALDDHGGGVRYQERTSTGSLKREPMRDIDATVPAEESFSSVSFFGRDGYVRTTTSDGGRSRPTPRTLAELAALQDELSAAEDVVRRGRGLELGTDGSVGADEFLALASQTEGLLDRDQLRNAMLRAAQGLGSSDAEGVETSVDWQRVADELDRIKVPPAPRDDGIGQIEWK